MAGITKVNGTVFPAQFYGRDLQIIAVAKTNMTQAEVDAMYNALSLRATVAAVGAFTAGTSDSVQFIVEGLDFTGADAYGTGNTYLDELSTATGLTVTAVAL